MKKYRIVEVSIEGQYYFYPQVKFLFFWVTIRTENQQLWKADGRWKSKYAAQLVIDNHKKSGKVVIYDEYKIIN